MGLPYGTAYVDALMRQFDRDGNGSVDSQEFLAYVHQKESALRAAFNALDVDNSGAITPDEVLGAMRWV